ncbi:MAG: glycine cleavage system aminomethyltransferase GcvT [Anaerolineae bacterium]|nr:glycine cleavage system aminomethyltransferase GcvT [Anaerolineae bacterium]
MMTEYWDIFLGRSTGQIDPDLAEIIEFEEERQARKLIMIPSESMAPEGVRAALGSVFNNVYAEGYPPLRMTRDDEDRLLDVAHQLAYYRRYADRRFYKGVDYVHFVETLAQRRCADCFANDLVAAENIYVNVQPLSGAAANLAVYDTIVDVGDVVMGMDLYQGGHLTHGSEFNFSGKRYEVVSYGVSKQTGKLDYDQIRDLAREHKPKMIIAGFTSYPWAPDWQAFRGIADEVGAMLLADISHPAGMVIAGAFPSPIGIADVTTFTTHKTLCGPRGAVIMTTDEDLATRIDLAVFPGEQGGPHTQKFAAMAVAFKIAQTEPFHRLQFRIKENAAALAAGLQDRGLKLAYGGTDSHFCMLDLNSVQTDTGFLLRGEPAVRILDLAGIVANKNTIPGDTETALAMGIRLGTPWLSQRGFGPAQIDQVAELIHRTVTNIHPFSYIGLAGELPRGKIDLDIFEGIKYGVAQLAEQGIAETEDKGSGYPHYYHLSPVSPGPLPKLQPARAPGLEAELEAARTTALLLDQSDCGVLQITGERAEPALQQVLTSDAGALKAGDCQLAFVLDEDGHVIDDVSLLYLAPEDGGPSGANGSPGRYLLRTNPENHERVKAWLRALSDGYTLFDRTDVFPKIEGPIIVDDLRLVDEQDCSVVLALHGPKSAEIVGMLGQLPACSFSHRADFIELAVPAAEAQQVYDRLLEVGATPGSIESRQVLRQEENLPDYTQCEGYGPGSGRPTAQDLYKGGHQDRFELKVPYFVGCRNLDAVRPSPDRPEFEWTEPEDAPLQRTPLYEWHKKHTRKIIPFAGWEMPVWYTGVLDEHNAVRKAAGLFDVAHMGVFEISGPHATEFLDLVVTNYVRWFGPGESYYNYFLDPDGRVIDDLLIYRRGEDLYLMVVNAANADKDWAWLNAVNEGQVLIDRKRPDLKVLRPATLRNLKDPSSGEDQRVDLALQGPASMAILQSLTDDWRLRDRLARVAKTYLIECELAGFDLIIARTGYTGEDVGYEIFVHPDRAVAFWGTLLEAGEPYGIKPCGLACRDSTRIEAGLPLYGHELAGPYDISPTGAGFGAYVKLHKPYFIGRQAHLEREEERSMEIARFRMNEKGVRMPKTGDPVVNRRGRAIGWVTSAAVDVDGLILGLAYVESRYHRAGDEIGIFSLPSRPVRERQDKADLEPGDTVQLPDKATILSRFPQDEEVANWRGHEVASIPRFLPAGE